MNPFKEKAKNTEDQLLSLQELYLTPYDKNTVDPYTKTRIILACGAEYEANWHSHQAQRKTDDMAVRRGLALTRFSEKQQQQLLAQLKPLDETILETTISYEQLAVDLTAELARKECNFYVKKALDFALLEDFDHLYRYSNLLFNDSKIKAENLVGKYTEIMPARPTVAHHRHPLDNVKNSIKNIKEDTRTILSTMIITAAEQQTMNYYMNVAAYYPNAEGRRLYEEICLVEEEHVTQYGSLIDANSNPFECALWHEYCECYLYWSNYMTESDNRIKDIWARFYEIELSHLADARKMLKKYCKKDYDEVICNPQFPEPLSLHENIDYVREILATTVQFTGKMNDYKSVNLLDTDDRFFKYNAQFTKPITKMPSHEVIKQKIIKDGTDYRYQTQSHPLKVMQNNTVDQTEVGIVANKAESIGFKKVRKSCFKNEKCSPIG